MDSFLNPTIIIFFLIGFVPGLIIMMWLLRRRKAPPARTPDSVGQNVKDVTPEALEKFENWLDEKSMPYVGLAPTGSPPESATASRLGGPAAMPQGTDWPVDKTGKAMLMLAQINMEKIEGLPDFPKKGVLQYFIASEDVFGLNFDAQLDSDFKILWHPDISKLTEIRQQPLDSKEDMLPFTTHDILEQGLGLAPAKVALQRPEWGVWFVGKATEALYELRGGEEAMETIFEAMDYHPHRVGGHPSFTQQDPREYGGFSKYNRVLLQIGCDKNVMFGDAGECTFFITEADLKDLRFDRVLYNWDCC